MICMLLAAAALSLLQAHGADRQPLRHSQLAGRRLCECMLKRENAQSLRVAVVKDGSV